MNVAFLDNIFIPYIFIVSFYLFFYLTKTSNDVYLTEIFDDVVKMIFYFSICCLIFYAFKTIIFIFQLNFEQAVFLFLFSSFSFLFFTLRNRELIKMERTDRDSLSLGKIKLSQEQRQPNVLENKDILEMRNNISETLEKYQSKLTENFIYHEIGHLILFLPLKHLCFNYFVSITAPSKRKISIRNGTLQMEFHNEIYDFIDQNADYRFLKGLIDLAGNVTTELFLQQKSIGSTSDYIEWENNLSSILKIQSYSKDIFYFNDVKTEFHAKHNAELINKIQLKQKFLIEKILKDNENLVETFVNLLKEKDKNLNNDLDRVLTQQEIEDVLSTKELIICEEWKKYFSFLE